MSRGLVFLFFATLISCRLPVPVDESRSPAMIGGSDRETASVAPFMVALRTVTDGKVVCSGMLIEPDLVLTAAHCVDDNGFAAGPRIGEIVFGRDGRSSSAPTRKVRHIYVHESYLQSANYSCPFKPCFVTALESLTTAKGTDLALIQIESPAPHPFTPIKIGTNEQIQRASRWVTAGYGINRNLKSALTHGGALQNDGLTGLLGARKVGFKTIDNVDTRRNFKKWLVASTSSGSTCYGDSGGALVSAVDDATVLWGVASHLAGAADEMPCGASAAAYTDVSTDNDWLISARRTIRDQEIFAKNYRRQISTVGDIVTLEDFSFGENSWFAGSLVSVDETCSWKEGSLQFHFDVIGYPDVLFPRIPFGQASIRAVDKKKNLKINTQIKGPSSGDKVGLDLMRGEESRFADIAEKTWRLRRNQMETRKAFLNGRDHRLSVSVGRYYFSINPYDEGKPFRVTGIEKGAVTMRTPVAVVSADENRKNQDNRPLFERTASCELTLTYH